jgi:hypothetical protein
MDVIHLAAGILPGSNAAVVLKLLTKLSKGLKGSLDGTPFATTSPDGSNLKKGVCVLKGWVTKDHGPVVRFRVKLGHLGDAEVNYDPAKTGWEETDEGPSDLDVADGKIVLTFAFTDSAGQAHQGEFHASA